MEGSAPPGLNISQTPISASELCGLIGEGWDCWGIKTSSGFLLELFQFSDDNTTRKRETCSSYLLLPGENVWRYETRGILYAIGLIYCFIGLASITASYMKAMNTIVRQTRQVLKKNLVTGITEIHGERVWNSTVADITLLALGTSSPQISLAVIDSIQHLGELKIGGLGPGTLVGSAAFNLLPTLAICVLIPKAGAIKRIEKIGVFIVELSWSIWAYIWLFIMLKVATPNHVSVWEALVTVLQFPLLILHVYAEDKQCSYISISYWSNKAACWAQGAEDKSHQDDSSLSASYALMLEQKFKRVLGWLQYGNVSYTMNSTTNGNHTRELGELSYDGHLSFSSSEGGDRVDGDALVCSPVSVFLSENQYSNELGQSCLSSWSQIWRAQIHNAMTVKVSRDENGKELVPAITDLLWFSFTFFWRALFAFIPPPAFCQGWPAFLCALLCIAGISTVAIQLANLFGCVSGVNGYVIAITVLASGSSFPDLIASKIAIEQGASADSGIANINTSNCINVFVGIGVPWLLQVTYNRLKFGQEITMETSGLSFSVAVYFVVFTLCWLCVFLRRLHFGGELGGPRNWARASSAFFVSLWGTFVLLSCLRVYKFL